MRSNAKIFFVLSISLLIAYILYHISSEAAAYYDRAISIARKTFGDKPNAVIGDFISSLIYLISHLISYLSYISSHLLYILYLSLSYISSHLLSILYLSLSYISSHLLSILYLSLSYISSHLLFILYHSYLISHLISYLSYISLYLISHLSILYLISSLIYLISLSILYLISSLIYLISDEFISYISYITKGVYIVNRGDVERKLAHHEAAIKMYDEALHIIQMTLGASHSEMADPLHSKGLVKVGYSILVIRMFRNNVCHFDFTQKKIKKK